ncbi:hypothetical protein [Paenibacillus terrigena]|uniref:hypothetical protein n=1 Tax=Paenibacillus terrigena TaxID=369333 RepID=UPI0028D59252|nr:hypothetical protein [Paenibacillus terrigena]
MITTEDVIAVKLDCIQLCKKMKDRPFIEKSFEDKETIGKFVHAIHKAEKRDGILDYGAIFLMTIEYKDGSTAGYHLNISNKERTPGLLAELPGTTIGYRISEEICNELRRIIYHG